MSDALTSASSEPEWAAFAAIDWADKKNFWRLLPTGTRRSEKGELENSPEAVEAWAASLQRRFGGRPIAVILEQSRGALVYMLTKYPVRSNNWKRLETGEMRKRSCSMRCSMNRKPQYKVNDVNAASRMNKTHIPSWLGV